MSSRSSENSVLFRLFKIEDLLNKTHEKSTYSEPQQIPSLALGSAPCHFGVVPLLIEAGKLTVYSGTGDQFRILIKFSHCSVIKNDVDLFH